MFQHSPFEPLGLLIPLLRAHKLRIRYVNFQRHHQKDLEIENYNGIIVLGGPMHPTERDKYPHLDTEIDYIKEAIDKDVPVLGICLGAQLLALALGGRCFAMPQAELGWHQVQFHPSAHQFPCFEHFNRRELFFQWHYCTYELSEHCSILATNKDGVGQAFHHQNRQLGLQFHVEANIGLLRRWLTHPHYLEQVHQHLNAQQIKAIQQQTDAFLPQAQLKAQSFIRQFIRRYLGTPPAKTLTSMHAGQ